MAGIRTCSQPPGAGKGPVMVLHASTGAAAHLGVPVLIHQLQQWKCQQSGVVTREALVRSL